MLSFITVILFPLGMDSCAADVMTTTTNTSLALQLGVKDLQTPV